MGRQLGFVTSRLLSPVSLSPPLTITLTTHPPSVDTIKFIPGSGDKYERLMYAAIPDDIFFGVPAPVFKLPLHVRLDVSGDLGPPQQSIHYLTIRDEGGALEWECLVTIWDSEDPNSKRIEPYKVAAPLVHEHARGSHVFLACRRWHHSLALGVRPAVAQVTEDEIFEVFKHLRLRSGDWGLIWKSGTTNGVETTVLK